MTTANPIFGLSDKLVHLILLTLLLITIRVTQAQVPLPSPKSETKAIHIFANQGPYGELYLPKELAAASNEFKIIQKQTAKTYFFPSIYFLVSARPNIEVQKQNKTGSFYQFKNEDRDLTWMQLMIKIEPVPCGQTRLEKDSVRILGLLPDETVARKEESDITQTVAGVGEIANASVPFVPALSTFIKTGSNVANVLFKNVLSPSKLATYRYSFVDSHSNFGWYWHSDKQNNTSLLGLRRGVLLLQAKRGVKGVKLSYDLIAKWNKDLNRDVDDEYVDQNKELADIDFSENGTCEKENKSDNFFTAQDYRFLKNLDGFPMLIPEDVVCDVFQVTISNCKGWIDSLLSGNQKLSSFLVSRPMFTEEKSIVRQQGFEDVRLIRRTDLEALLIEKKTK